VRPSLLHVTNVSPTQLRSLGVQSGAALAIVPPLAPVAALPAPTRPALEMTAAPPPAAGKTALAAPASWATAALPDIRCESSCAPLPATTVAKASRTHTRVGPHTSPFGHRDVAEHSNKPSGGVGVQADRPQARASSKART
jgi:hypothetical protein